MHPATSRLPAVRAFATDEPAATAQGEFPRRATYTALMKPPARVNPMSCAPPASLADAIVRIWGVEQLAPTHAGLPDGCVDILVTLSPRPGAFVIGAMSRATVIDRPPGHHVVGLSLQPGVASAVLGCASSQLTDEMVDLGDVIGRSAPALVDRIQRAEAFDARARVLQSFVQERLATARPGAQQLPLVRSAIDAIRSSEGTVSIAALARNQGCTTRVMERAFDRQVGLSPKLFSRIVRFHAAVRALRSGRRMTDVAYSLGFADQAHFIRDFSSLAGHTPREFIAQFDLTHFFNTEPSPPSNLVAKP